MKRSLLLLAGLTLAAAQANASKARLSALGQEEDGSHYISDTRNIFLNPAHVGEMGEFVTIEMGKTTDTNGTVTRNPGAEGGFTKALGPVKLGAYLGKESAFGNNLTAFAAVRDDANAAPTATTFLHPQNTLSIFVGGGEDLKFGGMLLYANSEDKNDAIQPPTGSGDRKARTMELRGGVATDMFDVYTHIELGSESKNSTSATVTATAKSGFNFKIGGAFKPMEGLTTYAEIYNGDVKFTDGNATPTDANKVKMMNWTLGAAHQMDIEGGTKFFYGAALSSTSTKLTDDIVGGTNSGKTETMAIPLTVGLEHEANSWMVLRGSIKQNVLINNRKHRTVTDKDYDNSTTVGAGAGLKFGKLMLDGTLAGASTGDINATSLLAHASMTYNF